MADWTDALPALNLETIRPIFQAVADKDKPRQLSTDRLLVRRTEKAVMLDARRLANAIEHLGRLPDQGEAFHLVTEKQYSMMHVIPATLHLAAPATIAHLTVVTLSFSQPNMLDLLAMLDAGQVAKVDFLFSVYFKSNEKENCQRLADELTTRGQRVFAGLIHAKLLLIELTDGRAFTVEASANLRSCASIEQLTMTHDRSLYQFHRTWTDEVLQRAQCAAEVAKLRNGQHKQHNAPQVCGASSADAAKAFSVSTRSVETAKHVAEKGDKSVVDAVKAGVVTVAAPATKRERRKHDHH